MSFLLWHGFRHSAKACPDRAAVQWRNDILTYRELDALSDAVAATLSAAGIGRGHRVALYMSKTHKSVIAMLGISKAGAAYVPIDPHGPALRAAYILRDCAVSAIVASDAHLESLREHSGTLSSLKLAIVVDRDASSSGEWVEQCAWRDLAAAASCAPAAGVETDPAYLLYTSGSTGTPKGVIITHRN